MKRGLITVKNNGGNKAAAYRMVGLYKQYAGDKSLLKEDEAEGSDETNEQADSLSGIAADNLSGSLSGSLSDNLSGSLSGSEEDTAGGKLSVLYKQKEKLQIKQNNKHSGTGAPKRARQQFKPPTIDEVEEYCRGRGSSVKPSQWLSYCQAIGWKVGKNSMKGWQASVCRNAAIRSKYANPF